MGEFKRFVFLLKGEMRLHTVRAGQCPGASEGSDYYERGDQHTTIHLPPPPGLSGEGDRSSVGRLLALLEACSGGLHFHLVRRLWRFGRGL